MSGSKYLVSDGTWSLHQSVPKILQCGKCDNSGLPGLAGLFKEVPFAEK